MRAGLASKREGDYLSKLAKFAELASEYKVEIDAVSEGEWSELLLGFEDASVYHTWSYGSVRWGEHSLSHVVLRRNGQVVALAQVSIAKVPVVGRGIAYITWGPLWRLRGSPVCTAQLQTSLRVLQHEYAARRGLLLRIVPNERETTPEHIDICSVFENEGFRLAAPYHRTLLMDLSPSMDKLRTNLRVEWRRHLKIAESNRLNLVHGVADDLFDSFSVLYDKMVARKGFVPGIDVNEFRRIQRRLPDELKMQIMVCESDGAPVAATVGSVLGNKGIYLLGASSEEGRRLKGSYLLQWRMIEWLKSRGAQWYDLNGYDPDNYPGTSAFKAGLAGKHAREVFHIGRFEACQSLVSSAVVRAGDWIKTVSRNTSVAIGAMKNTWFHRTVH
jgi:lipid II:glycine glycyltransferase (peptidoglycan interpeptide bridge formation enzyme)